MEARLLTEGAPLWGPDEVSWVPGKPGCGQRSGCFTRMLLVQSSALWTLHH